MNALLSAAEKMDRSELTHEQREALRADLTRIREFFEREFDRNGSRGVAVFSAGLDNAWRTLPLGGPVAEQERHAVARAHAALREQRRDRKSVV